MESLMAAVENIPFIHCRYKTGKYAKMKVLIQYASEASRAKLRAKFLGGATPSTDLPADMLANVKQIFG